MVSKDYIVGLTDGEGCFFVNVRPARSKTSRPWVETHFYIKVKYTDLPMLKIVQKTLGCGAIYRQKDQRPNHSECYRYEVNNRKDIREKVIPLFEKHQLQSVKRKEFVMFKKIAQMVDNKEYLKEASLEKIIKMKKMMSKNRGHRAR